MNRIKTEGILLTFGKKSADGKTYRQNGFSYKSFSDDRRVLVYLDEESALKEDLSQVIGRATLSFVDKSISFQIDFLDSVPGQDFFDAFIKNRELFHFIPAGTGEEISKKYASFYMKGLYPKVKGA